MSTTVSLSLFLLLLIHHHSLSVEAWTLLQAPRRQASGWQRPFRHLEVPDEQRHQYQTILPLSLLLRPSHTTLSRKTISATAEPSTQPTATVPWTTSHYSPDRPLPYMDVCASQLEFLSNYLTNVRPVALPDDLQHQQTDQHRIHTMAFESDEYEYIRMTNIDGGTNTQVFMSLWYPRDSALPTFGTNLLQFHQRTVGIVDWQPTSKAASRTFEDQLLRPIRNQYSRLQCDMTDRFYQADDGFCSNQMLLGRHDASSDYDVQELHRQVKEGAHQYMSAHVGLVRSSFSSKQQQQQQPTDYTEYDTYHKTCDPAHKLLSNMFGKAWADRYVSQVLFRAAPPSS